MATKRRKNILNRREICKKHSLYLTNYNKHILEIKYIYIYINFSNINMFFFLPSLRDLFISFHSSTED